MLVRDYMTPNPQTVGPNLPIAEALKLLREHAFRRLPVVDNQRLAGVVTDKDLKDATPSILTSLTVWELNYLLAKVTVSQVMSRVVITTTPVAPIKAAAMLMQHHKIGGLPVL